MKTKGLGGTATAAILFLAIRCPLFAYFYTLRFDYNNDCFGYIPFCLLTELCRNK